MPKVTLEISSCKDCPHLKIGVPYSSDGWDRMEDWSCLKHYKLIAKAVEWHDEKHIKIPTFCSLLDEDSLNKLKEEESESKKKQIEYLEQQKLKIQQQIDELKNVL